MKTQYIYWIGAIFLGGVAGYLYWQFIGCTSGSCAITSSPINSTLYGGVMGGLVRNLFTHPNKEKQK